MLQLLTSVLQDHVNEENAKMKLDIIHVCVTRTMPDRTVTDVSTNNHNTMIYYERVYR